jgi:hypothetical protein
MFHWAALVVGDGWLGRNSPAWLGPPLMIVPRCCFLLTGTIRHHYLAAFNKRRLQTKGYILCCLLFLKNNAMMAGIINGGNRLAIRSAWTRCTLSPAEPLIAHDP